MPVSMNPDDALQSFGIQSGRYRVVSSEWMVHQFPANKKGEQSEPFVCWAIGYLPIDESGKALGDVKIDYSMKVAPAFGESLSKAKFAPAQEPGRPLPLHVGAKGPYIEAVGDQSGFSDKSKVMIFLSELVGCGFDKSILATGDARKLIGTEGDVYQKVVANDGTDSSGAKIKDTKLTVFKAPLYKIGYEVSGTQAAGGTQQHTSQTTQAQTTQHAATNGGGAGSTVDLSNEWNVKVAVELMKQIQKKHAGKTMDMPELTKLTGMGPCNAAGLAVGHPGPVKADQRKQIGAIIQSAEFYARPELAGIAEGDGENVEFAEK